MKKAPVREPTLDELRSSIRKMEQEQATRETYLANVDRRYEPSAEALAIFNEFQHTGTVLQSYKSVLARLEAEEEEEQRRKAAELGQYFLEKAKKLASKVYSYADSLRVVASQQQKLASEAKEALKEHPEHLAELRPYLPPVEDPVTKLLDLAVAYRRALHEATAVLGPVNLAQKYGLPYQFLSIDAKERPDWLDAETGEMVAWLTHYRNGRTTS